MSIEASVDCDAKEQNDGTFVVTVVIGPLPPRAVNPVMHALRIPVMSALKTIFDEVTDVTNENQPTATGRMS